MRGRFDLGTAAEAAETCGRNFVEIGALLDQILAIDDAALSRALAKILTKQGEAVRIALRNAGATPTEAELVARIYLDAANQAGADRRRRAAH